MRLRVIVSVAALAAACDHGWPFQPGAYGPTGPFDPTAPVRLTFNPAMDRVPTWLPDGSALLYSAERIDRTDRDQCLALLPAGGGAIRWYACRTTAADDSINVLDEGVAAGDGRLAYVRAASRRVPQPVGPDAQAIVLATLDAPTETRVLRTIPFSSPSGHAHEAAAYLGWLGPTRLVYLGQRVTYPRPCPACVDTVRTGIEIAILDFASATPVVTIVPGTDSASSVAAGATGDTIYYTRNGDSRVYRYAFSSGQAVVVHDFGAGGIARGLTVRDGWLVVIVGGDVVYTVDSILGARQVDRGGPLYFVTLATGAEAVVGDAGSRYQRPALVPGAAHVAVEAPGTVGSDLWLVPVP